MTRSGAGLGFFDAKTEGNTHTSALTVDGIISLIAITNEYIRNQQALHKDEKHKNETAIALTKLNVISANLQLIKALATGGKLAPDTVNNELNKMKTDIATIYGSVADLTVHIPDKLKPNGKSTC